MIWRVEIASEPSTDSSLRALEAEMKSRELDVGRIERVRIFFIESEQPRDQVERAARQLADPIIDRVKVLNDADLPSGFSGSLIEIHLQPGVMDPAAESAEIALQMLGLRYPQVRSARQFRFENHLDETTLKQIARAFLASPVIEEIHLTPQIPRSFRKAVQSSIELQTVHVSQQPDDVLNKISHERHLFLNLEEMRAIRSYFKKLNREPTHIELETFAQTWSEHCIHKTLNSAVDVVDESGNVVRSYNNLIHETIFESTRQLIEQTKDKFALSVFKDNAGVISFDATDAICFKVETHNRPSAIEPYGGAATGLGGVIRDILGSGLGAKPIASSDVFCVAHPNCGLGTVPNGGLHSGRTLRQVVAGVRDYGNRMGVPIVNGAVYFDESYTANPLVFCGCIGIIPKNRIEKRARAGDAIVLMGGRTGRDGIHGATFSSGQLTDKHADEFSHAVQIGNPITQKKMMDVLLQARDRNLYASITDCGAGGLSSAVGEMGAQLGAEIDLDRVRLKYDGLGDDEIWISESQERMILSVPPEHVDELIELARSEDVEASAIGKFGNENRELVARFHQQEVMRLSMDFIHNGIPMPRQIAQVKATSHERLAAGEKSSSPSPVAGPQSLLTFLAHPNIASKHAIIRQYDHEVQGGTVIKPLIGPLQIGPSDAAVIRPKPDSHKAVVIACGLQPHIDDPYEMALASIDEAIRNAVCVGADLDRLALLDNFCWPSTDDPLAMGALVRACEACRDAAIALGTPFISGKDSLHNQFVDSSGKVSQIRNTLLISAIGVIDDFRKCVTMDLKLVGSKIVLIRPRSTDPVELSRMHREVSKSIREGRIRAIHDVSDGGALTALAEMCIASRRGVWVELDALTRAVDPFEPVVGHYIAELARPLNQELEIFAQVIEIATITNEDTLSVTSKSGAWAVLIDDMTTAWHSLNYG